MKNTKDINEDEIINSLNEVKSSHFLKIFHKNSKALKEDNECKSLIVSDTSISEFKSIIKDIITNDNVLALKDHIQHVSSSRFCHCLGVSYYSYVICKKLGLDYVSAARGGMLHDLYYYDWRNKHVEGQKRFHLLRHPRIALNNALEIFDLNDIEKDIILKHMWPLTVVLPKYPESYIVSTVDKYCATNEVYKKFKRDHKLKLSLKHNKNKVLESTDKNTK